jgi:phytoene dehydrogenase-like protein
VILEASDRVGGLATSSTDDDGFTWDVGGHVLFSHDEYYDRLVDRLLGDQYSTLNREAWVWMENSRPAGGLGEELDLLPRAGRPLLPRDLPASTSTAEAAVAGGQAAVRRPPDRG